MRWLLIISTLFLLKAHASTVSINLDRLQQMPAADLVYNGENITSREAYALLKSGTDLSKLNPKETQLWKNQSLKIESEVKIKDLATTSDYESIKTSPTEFFRFYVHNNGKRYLMTGSLENHANILRANLLRKLGYDVATPVFLKEHTVNFESEIQKKNFLENLGEATLTKKERWVKGETNKSLTLKSLTIETADLKNVNIYIPVMVKSRQESRRIFRSLLPIFSLTDFPQAINKAHVKTARVFDEKIIISHRYASEFQNVTYDDLIWTLERIQNLTEGDIKEIFRNTGYPTDIKTYLIELFKARIMHLLKLANLTGSLHYDLQINNESFKNGKLLFEYPEYVVNFYQKNLESPYRFKEMFRLFRTQTTYNALSNLLDTSIEKFVPGLRYSDSFREIQQNISDYRQENGSRGSVGLRSFSYPSAYVNASARRNVVFGQHMGLTAPIQLVDTVSADVSAGLLTGISGVSERFIPTLNAVGTLSRSYSHVRAMPDLESASQYELRKVLVPKLMKSIAQTIKLEASCKLLDMASASKEKLQGKEIYYIYYDKNNDLAKDEAIKIRTELLEQDISEDILLLVPVNKDEFCKDDIKTKLDESLQDFLDNLALNETFIITNSVRLNLTGQANIPLDSFLGESLSTSLSAGKGKGLLNAITIRKKDNSLEVFIQEQDSRDHTLAFTLNSFIEVIRASHKWFSGKQKTQIYKVPLNQDKDQVRKILKELFAHTSLKSLKESFHPYVVENDIIGSLKLIQFLWYKSERFQMSNNIRVTLPQDKRVEGFPHFKEYYIANKVMRDGSDFMAVFNRVLQSWSRYLNIGSASPDPGRTLGGHSRSRYYSTETEVGTYNSQKFMTKIEYVWRGWSAKRKTLNHIFNFIENMFSHKNLFEREQFLNSGNLKSYEVRNTILLSADFEKILKKNIIQAPYHKAVTFLKSIYPSKKWIKKCTHRVGPRRNELRRNCVPRELRNILTIRRGLSSDAKTRAHQIQMVILNLLEGFDRKSVIHIMKPYIFSTTRITGFLEDSPLGYVDYISNSVGHYDEQKGTGPIDEIANHLGLSSYELRAMSYSPGM